ncbi:MAG: hypothetical protein IT578_01730 [Verrucomicrobiae bacterium]|nr:hypothetical protein [Verrucomicrobiae bacterium]
MNRFLGIALLIVALAASGRAQSTTNVWAGGSGDWTNAAQWSAVAAPSATHAVFVTNAASSYTVAIDAGTDGASLTNFSLAVGHQTGGAGPTQTLSAVTASTVWRITTTNVVNERGVLVLDGTALSVGTNLRVRGQLIAKNGSSVAITSPAGNRDFGIGGSGSGSMASFSGGSLIVTNGTHSATLTVGDNVIGAGSLYVTNTLLHVSMYSQGTKVAYIDNSGLSETSLLRSVTVSVSGDTSASLTLAGGVFDRTRGRVALSGQNASITNRGAVWNMNDANNDLSIGNGVGARAWFVQQGGTTTVVRVGADTGEIRVGSNNGGTVTLVVASGLLTANGDGTSAGALMVGAHANGVGYFEQYGGRVVVTNGSLNAHVRVGDLGKGSFNMTNGVLLADRVRLGTNLQQLAVGASALVEVKSTLGFSNVAPLAVSNAFSFDGTLKFSPVTATATQRLVLAGFDLGATTIGFSNNFSLGTLDLDGFASGNRLQLFSGNSLASTALYVQVLSPIATNSLISSFNIYYVADLNPVLASGGTGGSYLLNGGGSLLPIALIPEPGSLALVALGALLLVRRAHRVRPE